MFWYSYYFAIYLSGQGSEMTNKKLAKMKNNIMFQNTFARLLQDALNRYKFNKLPGTISERVLLQSLLWYGSAVIFEKDGNLLCLPGVPTGAGFNIYGDPSECWVFSATGQFNEPVKVFLPGSDESSFLKNTLTGKQYGDIRGVFIRENALCYPFINQCIFFADAISDSMRTLDVCRQNIKQPYVIVAEESIVNSVKQFFKKRNNNEEYIISSGVFPADKINLLPFETNADNLDNATELVDWYENKWRELCSIENNGQIDKKGENLIEKEVDVNDQYTEMSVDKCIKYIQESLDHVNEIFGTNITVEPVEKERETNDNNDFFGDGDGNTDPVPGANR